MTQTDTNAPSSPGTPTVPARKRSRRRRVWAAVFLAGLAAASAISYPWWGWRIRALRETPLAGPWRLPEQLITVLTYNIRFGERTIEALDIIRAAEPDVVCLQEIKPSQVSKIERALGMQGYWSPSSNMLGDAAWGNAIFVDGSLDQVESLKTPDGRAFGVWAAANVKGGRFVVGSVHVMHVKRKDGGIGVRFRETRALLRAWSSLDAPAIIAGDFNEPPIGAVHRMMSTCFEDAAPDSGRTLPAPYPVTRIDYVFATSDWDARSGESIATSISDHRPVVARLRARQAATTRATDAS